MAGITLQQAQQHLDSWLAADTAVSKGQAYSVAGRSVTRADATMIQDRIDYWSRKVEQLEAGSRGGARVRYGTHSL
jgi:hypothetical protein